MTWVKLDVGFPEHPKILGLSDAAFRLHVYALCYASRHLTDGAIPLVWLTGGKSRAVPKAATQLVTAGVWDEDGPNFRIHDYLEYQRSRDEASEQSRLRAEAGRRGGKANAKQIVSTTPKQTPSNLLPQVESREEERRSDQKRSEETPKTSSLRGSPLVMSPLEFAKAQERCAFVGTRLQVPHKLHADFRRDLGGVDPDQQLMAWYGEVDQEIEVSGESILPDVWKWLSARFKTWALSQSGDDELRKFREGT